MAPSKKNVVKKTRTTRRKRVASYNSYIFKVMKQVHPDLQMSKQTIMAANGLLEVLMAKLTKSSADIAKCAKKSTLSARHVQGAVKLVMPGDLAKHAVSEGTKSTIKFTN